MNWSIESEPLDSVAIEKQKKRIDAMSQYDMCRLQRFCPPCGDPIFDYRNKGLYEYFVKSLQSKGGMTPEISKALGW